MLVGGVNGALTRADENEVGEQQLTPRAPLNCKAAARRSKPLEREGGKEIERRKRHISITLGQHEGGPRCWRAAREKFCCSPPRSPAGLRALRHAVGHGHRTKKLKPPTRVCVALPLGAPAILSCAAVGVSGVLTGAVNAVTTKSKLDKIKARTVHVGG